jgi:hypothetical protein
MALGSTQPLTEISTRNLPAGKGRPARKAEFECVKAAKSFRVCIDVMNIKLGDANQVLSECKCGMQDCCALSPFSVT